MYSSALAGARSSCAQPKESVNSCPMLEFCKMACLLEGSDAGSPWDSVRDTKRSVRAKWLLPARGCGRRGFWRCYWQEQLRWGQWSSYEGAQR
jgi:hypothetical protein